MNPSVKQQRKGVFALIIFVAVAFGTASGLLIATGLDWIPHSKASVQDNGGTVAPSEFLLKTQESFREIVSTVRPAVVSIMAEGVTMEGPQSSPFGGGQDPFEQFFGPQGSPFGGPMQRQPQQAPKAVAAGSGFIVDPEGYILTNNHVVQGASKVKVKLDDGRDFDATIIGSDPETDVAVIKIEDKAGLPYVRLGDSDKLEVGDWVMAIGNPFGNLAGTVTVGIVSASHRENLQLPGNTVYKDFIQTDAAINLGNSGGPLVDVYGHAVGINTAITSQGSGIGFAIPIKMAKYVYDNIRQNGKVIRGWVGITIQNLDEDLAKNLGLPDNQGALVADVKAGDPADKAGLKDGDVILSVGGTKVTSSASASRTIAALLVGQATDLVIWRDGHEMTVTITPIERAKDVGQPTGKPGTGGNDQGGGSESQYLGITVSPITDQMRQDYGIPSTVTGVIVTGVDQNGPAYDKGLSEGMIISGINSQKVATVGDYTQLMGQAKSEWDASKKTVRLKISLPQQDGTWMSSFYAVPFE
jgi:serine protease Do